MQKYSAYDILKEAWKYFVRENFIKLLPHISVPASHLLLPLIYERLKIQLFINRRANQNWKLNSEEKTVPS
jgi:hypothetical protein